MLPLLQLLRPLVLNILYKNLTKNACIITGVFLFLKVLRTFKTFLPLTYMLVLRQGVTADNIVVTLAEKITLPVPYFVFVFTHVTTKDVVTYLPALADDISVAKERYNEFLVPMSLFTGKAVGQWQYKVFEAAASTSNTTGLNLLENGKMFLVDNSTVSLIGYNSITTMTGYKP